MTGGCACGRVRFRAEVEKDDAYLCHCRMCQRATGNISVAFKNLPKRLVEWEGDGPDWYQSSLIARRPFCSRCGSSLGFEYPDSENMDLTVATFDEPQRFVPKHHFGVESRLEHWRSTDGLPEYRTSDYQLLVDRWMKAIGKLPD